MPRVILRRLTELTPRVERVLRCILPQLTALLPNVELDHIGATAIPGSLTKGDVDILLRVSATYFAVTAETLRQHFTVKQPANWTPEFASFGDDTAYELPLGI